ncbi:pectate lyase [Saccharophagus sp. K07]|uniref:pectate lyase n=1 Tax=Saccharophagus sp. K07 TaxID=2283636 RepID=UPI001652A5A8|nr:pectate lyase [Saccharophagus sp. K07]
MQNSDSLTPSGTHGVLIQSVGTATLTSAAAVAKGLGISAAEVINCLYRAPAVLVDKVEQKIAEQLSRLLTDIGYEVTVIDDTSAIPKNNELFDVALYLKDASQLPEATRKLSKFIGMSEEEASKMLLQPPGMALGSVSEATVNAFREFMGDTVDMIAAPQADARYDVFLGECPTIVQKRLLEDLTAAGIPLSANSGLIATGVERSAIDPIWQRHKTNGALRIIQQDFLRFDVVLQQAPNAPLSNEQRRVLEDIVEIPQDIADEVVASAPVTLLESIPSREVPCILEALAQAQLTVAAELITFQALGLKITACAQTAAVNAVLNAFGIPHTFRRAPEILPNAYPEIQARVIRDALERAGASVELLKH